MLDIQELDFQNTISEREGDTMADRIQRIEAIEGEVRSEPLNRNFSYVESKAHEALRVVEELREKLHVEDSLQVTVGNNADFTSLQEALEAASKELIKPLSIDIKLENDFILMEQIKICDRDLAHITITSNTEIKVEVSEGDLEGVAGYDDLPIFYGCSSRMPVFDVRFRFNRPKSEDNKYVTGILVDDSNLVIRDGNGFTNFPYNGLHAVNSKVVADHCDFSNSGNRDDLDPETYEEGDEHGTGIIAHTSTLSADGSKASDCGHGFQIVNGSFASLDEAIANGCARHGLIVGAGSVTSARSGEFTGTIEENVVAYGNGLLDLRDSNCSNGLKSQGVMATYGSQINFSGGVANNCHSYGVIANRVSSINADNVEANNCGASGFGAFDGSTINARNSVANDNDTAGYRCDHGTIYCQGGTANNNGKRGVHAINGSTIVGKDMEVVDNAENGVISHSSYISMPNSTVRGSSSYDFYATQGGKIVCNNSISSNEGDDDYHISLGGIIIAFGCEGLTNGHVNAFSIYGVIMSNTVERYK